MEPAKRIYTKGELKMALEDIRETFLTLDKIMDTYGYSRPDGIGTMDLDSVIYCRTVNGHAIEIRLSYSVIEDAWTTVWTENWESHRYVNDSGLTALQTIVKIISSREDSERNLEDVRGLMSAIDKIYE